MDMGRTGTRKWMGGDDVSTIVIYEILKKLKENLGNRR